MTLYSYSALITALLQHCVLGHRVSKREGGATMGISSKWIKSLVGIRKHEKGHNTEKQQKGQNAESSETVSHGVQSSFISLQPN